MLRFARRGTLHQKAMGRWLISAGLMLVVAGLLVVLLERAGLRLGRLPGDLSFRGRHTQIFLPLGTSLLVSIVLSLVLYLLARLRR